MTGQILEGRRFLIVEDETHLAEGLRFNLEAEGYAIQLVPSGEEALELLRDSASHFDLLILDVMLPGRDGFTVMKETREAGNLVPRLDVPSKLDRSDGDVHAAGNPHIQQNPHNIALVSVALMLFVLWGFWRSSPPPRSGSRD